MHADRPERASAKDPWLDDVIEILREHVEDGNQIPDPTMLVKAVRESTKECGSDLLIVLKRQLSGMLAEHEEMRIGFEKRLHQLWGTALDALYMLIVMSREAGEDYNAALGSSAVERQDFVFEALVRLHVKACRVALEATHLLRSGFSSGSHARWRTLHEVAVTSSFICHHGHEAAERYLQHWIMEAAKDLEEYEKHHQRLGYAAPEPHDIQTLRARREELLKRYGRDYRHTHGWAAAALNIRKPTFVDIEASAKLDHYRPLYGLSNHWIHSGSRSLTFDLGLEPGQQFLLAGASTGGLAEPGHAVAISLTQTTATLLSWSPRMKDLITLQAIVQLTDEIGNEFHRAHLEHQQLTRDALSTDVGEPQRDKDDVSATE